LAKHAYLREELEFGKVEELIFTFRKGGGIIHLQLFPNLAPFRDMPFWPYFCRSICPQILISEKKSFAQRFVCIYGSLHTVESKSRDYLQPV